MNPPAPVILESLRLPGLYRKVFLHAGVPLPPDTDPGARFLVRSGAEPPGLLAGMLREAFAEEGADVVAGGPAGVPDPGAPAPGQAAVLPGFDAPCPDAAALRRAAAPEGGPVLLFAVERRGPGGRLLGVTWAAVPEGEPPPTGWFRAAVVRYGDIVGAA